MSVDEKKAKGTKQKTESAPEVASGSLLSRVFKITMIVLLLMVMATAAFGLTKYVIMPNYEKFKQASGENAAPGSGKDVKIGRIYTLKSISVNPLFSNGTRFVVAGLAVEYTKSEMEDELKERDPQIRDSMIRYFRRHTADQMLDVAFQEKSRKELTKEINSLLTVGDIDSLYYIELILQ